VSLLFFEPQILRRLSKPASAGASPKNEILIQAAKARRDGTNSHGFPLPSLHMEGLTARI